MVFSYCLRVLQLKSLNTLFETEVAVWVLKAWQVFLFREQYETCKERVFYQHSPCSSLLCRSSVSSVIFFLTIDRSNCLLEQFYFHLIILRTDLLAFGVASTVFRIADELRRLLAYFDNPNGSCALLGRSCNYQLIDCRLLSS